MARRATSGSSVSSSTRRGSHSSIPSPASGSMSSRRSPTTSPRRSGAPASRPEHRYTGPVVVLRPGDQDGWGCRSLGVGSARAPPAVLQATVKGAIPLAVVSMRDLLEAGVHFGHQTRRWNPKMKRFIFTERGGIYIIDLTQTSDLLQEAYDFARNLAERGGTILFVGTKKQAQDAVSQEAGRVGMPYVAHRWLGGLLTNWRTITDRIAHLHELRRLKSEGQLELLPAKERITMLQELEKLEANLGGDADLRRQPDAVFIVDLKKEQLAVREARRLGV